MEDYEHQATSVPEYIFVDGLNAAADEESANDRENDHEDMSPGDKLPELTTKEKFIRYDVMSSFLHLDSVSLAATASTEDLTSDDKTFLLSTGNAEEPDKYDQFRSEEGFEIEEMSLHDYSCDSEPEFTYMNIPTPKSRKDNTPITIVIVRRIGGIKTRKIFKVLLDIGSTRTMINKKCLPRGQ